MPVPWDDRLIRFQPPSVRDYILANEDERLRRLVSSLESIAGSLEEQSPSKDILVALDDWLGTVELYMRSKYKHRVPEVVRLYHCVIRIAKATQATVPLFTSVVNAATTILSHYRHYMQKTVEVDFDTYFEFFQYAIANMKRTKFAGIANQHTLTCVTQLCKQARRLFPPATASRVWGMLEQRLEQSLSPDCLDAITMLLIFFPHHAINRDTSLPWNAWASKAVDLCNSMAHSAFCEGSWICFLSRLAKHDTYDVIDWPPLLKRICARAVWLFNVPVGQSGQIHYKVIYPTFPYDQLAPRCRNAQSSVQSYVAKILVYTLRRTVDPGDDAGGGLSPLGAIRSFATLLEHYFHASNNGHWSESLANFLSAFAWHLVRRRLVLEATVWWHGKDSVRLDPAALEPVARELLRLALPAMYHKSSSLESASLEVITNLVYLAPRLVLPQVWKRFMEALNASDSVHQLAKSIRILAGCARPMLLDGLDCTPEEEELMDDSDCSRREWACRELGRAMMLLLPGIDANDRKKTQATISFYVAVLSSCVAVTGHDAPRQEGEAVIELGLYIEDWVLELLQKLFAVISGLESGNGVIEGSGDELQGVSASWLASYYKFEALLLELFTKVSDHVAKLAMNSIAQFALGLSEPQQAADTAKIVRAACERAPADAVDMLLVPLMRKLEDDIEVVSGTVNPSASGAKRTAAHLVLLAHTVLGIDKHIPKHAETVFDLILKSMRVASPLVMNTACRCFNVLIMTLIAPSHDTHAYFRNPSEGPTPLGVPGSINNAVMRWLPRNVSDAREFIWIEAADDDARLALSLGQRGLDHARETIEAMIADGSIKDASRACRMRLRGAQTLILGVLTGFDLFCIPQAADEAVMGRAAPDEATDSLRLCMPLAPALQPCCTLQTQACRLSLDVLRNVDSSYTWSMRAAINALTRLSGIPQSQLARSAPGASLRSRDRSYNEPAVSDLLLGLSVNTLGKHTRQPFWATLRMVEYQYIKRRGDSLCCIWPSTSSMPLKLGQLSPLYREVVSALLQANASRFHDVQLCAAQALHSLLSTSPELVTATVPSVVASAVLFVEDPTLGAPPESFSDAAFSIPSTVEDAKHRQARQITRMLERLGSGSTHGNGSQEGDAVDGDAKDKKDGVATQENRHRVSGALMLLGMLWSQLQIVAAIDMSFLASAFLLSVMVQRYEVQELKRLVSNTLLNINLHIVPPAFARRDEDSTAMLDRVTDGLLDALASSSLQWKNSILSAFWMLLVAPLPDPSRVSRIVQTLLQQMTAAANPLVRDMACSTLQQILSRVQARSLDWPCRDEYAAAVRTAFADESWASSLVKTLDQLHGTLAFGSARERMSMLQGTAETAFSVTLRTMTAKVRQADGSLHLSPVPPTPKSASDQQTQLLWHVASLVECFGWIDAVGLLAACKRPLLDWSNLAPEKEVEPHMEYTAMEICSGAIVSGAAFATTSGSSSEAAEGSGASAWNEWMKDFVQSRFVAVAPDKARIWSYVLALSLRRLANVAVGVTDRHGDLTPQAAPPREPFAHVHALADFVCELAGAWSGRKTTDGKATWLLNYSIDVVVQLQSAHAAPALAVILQQLLSRAIAIVNLSLAHPLQHVRLLSSALVIPAFAALRSPVPLLDASHRDEADDASLASKLVAAVHRIGDRAVAALASANAAASSQGADAGPNGVTNVGDIMAMETEPTPESPSTNDNGGKEKDSGLVELEGAIGSAAAVTSALASSTYLQPRVQDVLLALLPKLLDMQSLQNPDLQSLTMPLRAALAASKAVVFWPVHVPELQSAVLRSLRHSGMWQTRAAAVAMLQVLWFRNYFSITHEDVAEMVSACRDSLVDDKLEIRDLAAQTLSGLLKVLRHEEAAKLREETMRSARQLFAAPRRGKAAAKCDSAATGPQRVRQQHACVLMLGALLQSSPYELQDWSEDALLMVLKATKVPPPVRTAATRIINAFRTTHETTENLPLKERLREDVVEELMNVNLQSSYFA